jgi:predicted RNA-binding Zn ribbon-like protein
VIARLHECKRYTSVMSSEPGALSSVSDPATERFAAAPAPASLQRVQSFLNTREAGLPVEPDLLARPGSANRWLRTFEWPTTPRLTADDLTPLRDLRQSLQAQLQVGQDPPQVANQADLVRQLEDLRWKMTLEDGQLTLSPVGGGWRPVAGALLGDIFLAQQHDVWPRLKACRNAICSVIFYDSSKNQSRVWCNTQICGNRINLNASRARRRQEAS